MKYILYKVDGTHEVLERETKIEYEELSKLVGGMVESSESFEDNEAHHTIFLNENGISEGLKPNPFFTPMYQENFLGDIVEGIVDENGDFVGDDLVVIREVKKISPLLFEKDRIFHIIAIGGFIANTTRGIVKSTGQTSDGKPIFKEAKKGARKLFTLRNLTDKDVMIFENETEFTIDGEVKQNAGNGMTCSTIRGNALFNLHGDIDRIREFVKKSNINPFFTAYDRINHIGADNETETLVFMDRFASCQMVADRQQGQLKREGHNNIKVGVGSQIISM